MAALVMRQLEMTREVLERQRAMRMGQALASFVEGKPHVSPPTDIQKPEWNLSSHSPFDRPLPTDNASAVRQDPQPMQPPTQSQAAQNGISPDEVPSRHSSEDQTASSREFSSSDVHTASLNDDDNEESMNLTFSRAAYLIREGLDVQGWYV
jgi:hypothetical protein